MLLLHVQDYNVFIKSSRTAFHQLDPTESPNLTRHIQFVLDRYIRSCVSNKAMTNRDSKPTPESKSVNLQKDSRARGQQHTHGKQHGSLTAHKQATAEKRNYQLLAR